MTDDRSQSWSSLMSTDRMTLAAAPHRCCSYGTHPSRTTRGHGALPPHHDGTQPRSTPPLAPLSPPPRLAPQRHDRSTSPCRARWPHRRPGRRHPPPRGHPRFPQSRPSRLPPPPPFGERPARHRRVRRHSDPLHASRRSGGIAAAHPRGDPAARRRRPCAAGAAAAGRRSSTPAAFPSPVVCTSA